VFDPKELNDLEEPNAPPHLRTLDFDAAARITSVVIDTFGKDLPRAVLLEMQLFVADKTPHNAGRLAKSCQAHGAIGAAAAIDVVLKEVSAP
jgi:hypothetical protein